MKASELIKILQAYPDYGIQIETQYSICDIRRVDIDCFDEAEGMVFVLEADDD